AAEHGVLPPSIEVVELPDGYHLSTFLKQRKRVSAQLLSLMQASTYNLFPIGGWIGDWGVTAALTAQSHGIPHAIWFDRVESQVVLGSTDDSLTGKLKAQIRSKVMSFNERRLLRRADLALLHGRTVFERFAPVSKNPHLVEDIHLTEADHISDDALESKLTTAADGAFRIVYAGRATAMKGPLDWVDVIAGLASRGIDVRAEWLGDGDELAAMKQLASERGIEDRIDFKGFVSDRSTVLQSLRNAHCLLFCHLTDESPRILIEALHSGTPLIGYQDPFARSLVEEQAAGHLVARGDKAALTDTLTALAQDRQKLQGLIERAAQSALHLTREQVFRHRSEIVKSELPQNRT
ncbi:MAG: glycosyltransferase, partial [Pseudomonadota bacterium]